jgi:hypothetical protein
MIIIKIDEARDDATNIAIASMLFNMELGCKAFNPDGEIDDPDEDFHVMEKDGISYTIQGIIGNIVVLYSGDDRRYIEFLAWDLEKALRILDDLYIKARVEGIPHYTGKSLDYTLVSELQMGFNNKNNSDRRKIVHKADAQSHKSHFVWRIVDDGTKILFTDNTRVYDRNVNEYNHLVQNNTLVIDIRNVFESKENITFTNGLPSKRDYSMSNKFVSYDVFTYSEKYGGIDSVLRSLKNQENKQENKQEMQDIIIDPLFIPVYEEEWDNINPMRAVCRDIKPAADHIIDLLNSSYNYTLMELEEVKNVESGAPPTPNDVCHSCEMYLYDMIYVLELKDNHVCVCAKCFHGAVYPTMFDNFNCTDINVLKVRHPRTVVDVIDTIDMSEEFRSLMTELSGDVTIRDGVITTPNYAGYTDIDSILLKTVTPPEDKRLFVCKILS